MADAEVPTDSQSVDAPIDTLAIDAPVQPPPPLDCSGTPEVVVDVGLGNTITSFVVLDDIVYYSTSTIMANGARTDGVVRALDLVTRQEAMTPLDVGVPWTLTATANSVWAPAIGKVWRLQNGQTPVQVVSGRGNVEVATADDSYVYWAEEDPTATTEGMNSTVWRQLIAGGSAQALGRGDIPLGLHVTDSTLYCSDFEHGALKYGPKDGGRVPIVV